MKLLKRAIFSMFPFTTISNTSLASLNFELETNLDDQRSTFNDCSRDQPGVLLPPTLLTNPAQAV